MPEQTAGAQPTLFHSGQAIPIALGQQRSRNEPVQSSSRKDSMVADRGQRGFEPGSSWQRHDWKSASGDVQAVRGGSPERKSSLAAAWWLQQWNPGRMGRLRVARMHACRNESESVEKPLAWTRRSDAFRVFGSRRAGPIQDRLRRRATPGPRKTRPAEQASGWR